MSDPYPTGGNMANPESVTPGQAAQAAADQLAGQAAAAPAPDAGASLEQMQQANREVLLPMEQRINDLMAAFQSSQDKQAAQIAELQSQLAAARQQAGPPAVEQYANGAATLIRAHLDANPDVPREAFASAVEVAKQLQAAATDAVASRDPAQVQQLAGRLEQWANRGVGKHLDFSALRADLELLGEAAARLAA